MKQFVNSCEECEVNCCSTGPPPRKTVSPIEYLYNFGKPDGYQTQCEHLTDEMGCRVWGTSSLPEECRSYVCPHRIFSDKELRHLRGGRGGL